MNAKGTADGRYLKIDLLCKRSNVNHICPWDKKKIMNF